jgi:hypothetical protein
LFRAWALRCVAVKGGASVGHPGRDRGEEGLEVVLFSTVLKKAFGCWFGTGEGGGIFED